jgi:hypothetical protein
VMKVGGTHRRLDGAFTLTGLAPALARRFLASTDLRVLDSGTLNSSVSLGSVVGEAGRSHFLWPGRAIRRRTGARPTAGGTRAPRPRRAAPGSPALQIFQQYVAAYGLVYTEEVLGRAGFPAHQGSLDLQHARPLEPATASPPAGEGTSTPR